MLTIFTPTYNRADLLNNIFNNLSSQSYMNFEWIIIDDGSTDQTKDVVNIFKKKSNFPIHYYWKQNGGKHTAYNFALNFAKGELFMCLDSDDVLTDNAIELIKNYYEKIKYKENCCGFIGYKENEDKTLLSPQFPKNLDYSSLIDLDLKYDCRGEYTLVYKTNIARQYLFPIFKGENFVGENVVYDKIDENYTYFLLRNSICLCKYFADGYTSMNNTLMKNNPSGYCIYFMQRIDYQNNIIKKVKIAAKYHCFKKFAKKDSRLNYDGKNKVIIILSYPLGIIYFVYYKIFRKF